MNSETPKSRPRPLSPHIQVYSWLITSTMSILHRLTGVALSLGLVMLAIWLISMAYWPECHKGMAEFLRGNIGKALMFGWSFALFYHLCNGIRHLNWDIGKGFKLEQVTSTGHVVIFVSICLTILTWMAGYGMVEL